MRCQYVAAGVDGCDEAVGDAAVFHVREQRVDGGLPLPLRHAGGDAVVGDDAGVVLRQRDEDQDAAAVLGAGDAALDELVHGDAMGGGTPRPARKQAHAHARQEEQGRQAKEHEELQQENSVDRPGRGRHQQPGQHQCHHGRGEYRQGRHIGRTLGQHADNLARRPCLRRMDGGGNACAVLLGNRHHQLPEAPPPPDEPPPPEKPPPPPPPEKPPPEKPPPRELRELPDMSMVKKSRRKPGETMSRRTRPISPATTNQFTGPESRWLSSRREGRCCHSEESVVSTVMMSSTPRVMPSPKSPALKRGVIALVMITFDSASVSVPSRP